MYYFNADTRKHTHTDTHTQTNKLNTITLLCKINKISAFAQPDYCFSFPICKPGVIQSLFQYYYTSSLLTCHYLIYIIYEILIFIMVNDIRNCLICHNNIVNKLHCNCSSVTNVNSLKCMSWNMQGLEDTVIKDAYFNKCLDENDIVILLETWFRQTYQSARF